MNIPAAVISAGIGAALFAAMNAFSHGPSPPFALNSFLATKQSKARAAVARLLIDPPSADFNELRSIQADAAEYVCGHVRARDRSGRYADFRAFVYTVATDVARIDDDGRIAHRHGSFRRCPVSEEEERLRNKPALPAIAAVAKSIQTNLPADASVLSTLAPDLSAGGARPPSGGSLEQQIGQMSSQLVAAGPSPIAPRGAGPAFNAASAEVRRRSEQSAAWPRFASDHPLAARPAKRWTAAQALALARDVEERWERSSAGASASRPSPDEIREACRALLAIDPKDEAYPVAWAAFMRLRKMDPELG